MDLQDVTQTKSPVSSTLGIGIDALDPLQAGDAAGAVREPLVVLGRSPAWWIVCFMVLGIAARVVRFALNFPLGSDEAYLASNLIDKGFLDLLGPLNYEQVCPLLFLWGQLACVKLFGFSEYALRLLPLVFGVTSVFVFRHMAGRVLRGTTLALAVGVFAAAYPGIRYSGEAKPYEADLWVALLLLAMAVEWLRCPQRHCWLWALAAIVPIGIGLSYPAVFVAGGISLTIAWTLWTQRLARGWPVWVIYNMVLLESFLALFAISMANQSSGCLTEMRLFWHNAFPPLAHPGELAAWFVSVHTGVLLAHPVGGPHGGSTLTLLACTAAVVVLVRRRQTGLAMVCLFPLALQFVAAAIHRYPYGGHVRLAMHFAPACCLLTGLGASAALAWLSKRGADASRWTTVAFGLMAVLPIGSAVRDACRPYRAYEDVWTRDFARWFWPTSESQGEVACLKTDLGRDFSPDNFRLRFSAVYLCNQRIYSPRHARGEPVRWDRVSAAWPLCCVEYKSSLFRYEKHAFEAWLDGMRSRYDLVDRQTFPMAMGKDAGPQDADSIEVYRFVPKADLAGRGGAVPIAAK